MGCLHRAVHPVAGLSALAQTNVDKPGAAQLVQLINQERASQGIQPLAVDQRLAEAACEHSELMAAHKALSHQFHEESTLAVRFADANLHSSQQAENIDFSKDVTSAHKGFMRSPANRATILDSNYNAVGVCAIRSHRHVYVTEDFAHRLKDYSEPEMDAALQRAIETYTTAHGMPTPVRKQESQLGHMACDMARSDSLQDQKAADLPGVQWGCGLDGVRPRRTSQQCQRFVVPPDFLQLFAGVLFRSQREQSWRSLLGSDGRLLTRRRGTQPTYLGEGRAWWLPGFDPGVT